MEHTQTTPEVENKSLDPFEIASNDLQDILGPEHLYRRCTNRGNAGDFVPYLLLLQEREAFQIVFEDTTLQAGRMIHFKLRLFQHVVIGYRFTCKDGISAWESTSQINDTQPEAELAKEIKTFLEGTVDIAPLQIMSRAVNYFFQGTDYKILKSNRSQTPSSSHSP